MEEEIKGLNEDAKLLGLSEHPVWGVFVQMVDEDLKRLDTISSLFVGETDRDALVREIEIRYHTIERVRSYVNETISRANDALQEQEESKSDVVNVVEPQHL